MSSSASNQAMEPVGIGSLTPHAHVDHAEHHEVSATKEYKPPVRQLAGFTAREIAGAVAFVVILVAIMFFTAVAMAVGVWVFHFLAHLILPGTEGSANYRTAQAWGNAVGTIAVISLGFVMILATLLTMGERKWSALIQDRVGPNRARLPIPGLQDKALWGLPHILADVLKMLTKEELVPAMGSKLVFQLAPALAFGPAFVLFAVVPMAPPFRLWGYEISMQVASIDVGLLYVFGIASIAVLGTSLAGWASNNKYALLGGVRASAQMISYEVTLGLTLVGLMLVFRTLRLETMSAEQGKLLWGWLPAWGIIFQPLAIIAYLAAAHAEMKRVPFDLPEGESEIVGYFIEYSGLKFGLFMIAELVEVVVFAGLFTALFFGGWHIPWVEGYLNDNLPSGLLHLLAPNSTGAWHDFVRGLATGLMGFIYLTSFVFKTVFFCWLSLAIRWTFPRFRYDQIMNLGWKILLPLSLLNVVVTGFAVLIGGMEAAAIVGLVEIALILFFGIGALKLDRTGDETLLPTGTPAPAAAHGGAHH